MIIIIIIIIIYSTGVHFIPKVLFISLQLQITSSLEPCNKHIHMNTDPRTEMRVSLCLCVYISHTLTKTREQMCTDAKGYSSE